ncbi:hypothetical protein JY438_02830 [Stenotrophomonas maltophilia]|nr:hypothetical protein [Stenotrophomonas maltophilia]
MNLAAEIVATLAKEKADLVDALVKTRILASRLGNKSLADWCRLELSGYPIEVDVPSYRKISLTPVATIANGFNRQANRPLPLGHLTPEQREHFTKSSVRQGVSAIQSWVGKEVGEHFPVDQSLLFRSILPPGWFIENLMGRPPLGAYEQIIVEIRARLLEFCLEVQDALPADDSDAKPITPEMNDKITNLLNGSVIGNNNVFQFGQDNVATVSYGFAAGDLASLIQVLKQSGVGDHDAGELAEAIESDGDEPSQKKQLGPRVRAWFGEMLAKAANETWKISVTAAVSLLAGTLGAFYGFPVA